MADPASQAVHDLVCNFVQWLARVSVRTVDTAIADVALKVHRIGSATRIRLRDAEAWLRSCRRRGRR